MGCQPAEAIIGGSKKMSAAECVTFDDMCKGPSMLRAALFILEALACFSLPVYLWLLGLLSAPLWYYAAVRAGTFPTWTFSYIAGGGFGLVALASFLRYLLSRDAEYTFSFTRNIVFACLGLFSIWGYVTTDFQYFDVDGFTAIAAGLPSLCFAHLLFLAVRKARSPRAQRGHDHGLRSH